MKSLIPVENIEQRICHIRGRRVMLDADLAAIYIGARPFAFTEHGVVMLASVLKSPAAVQAGVLIVRAFNRFRELLASRKEMVDRLREEDSLREAIPAARAGLERPRLVT